MKAKNGISLIVLVITIVVIIILAAAVILSLGNNNPINNSKIAAISQTRDNLESAVSLYLSSSFAKYTGEYSAEETLTAKRGEDDITGITAVVDTASTKTFNATTYYKIIKTAAKSQLEIDLTNETCDWYLAPSTGKVLAVYSSVPSYFMDGTSVVDSVAGFVTK